MTITSEIVYYWMHLASISRSKQNALLQECDSELDLWYDLDNIAFRSKLQDKLDLLQRFRDVNYISNKLDQLDDRGIQLISIKHKSYPVYLQNIYDPPKLLFAQGDVQLLESNCVAVVGTRYCTRYGQLMSKKMVNDLVDCGLTIVSGLATGIDTYAHRAAIDRNGNTIAVIAGGFDNIHPAINTNLSTNIASQGLLLSEYAPHIVPKPYMFVERNRIVSGLSHGVLVVEAGIKSGAMITANLGLEQGRNIYCVPGNVNSSQSMGTNQLIKQGAMLVTDGIEIARDLRLICESATLHSTQQVKLDFFEQQVYDVLMLKGKLSFDSLVDILQCNARELAVILTNMEIKSIIVKHPNNLYSCD